MGKLVEGRRAHVTRSNESQYKFGRATKGVANHETEEGQEAPHGGPG